jgi:hypothetical protein
MHSDNTSFGNEKTVVLAFTPLLSNPPVSRQTVTDTVPRLLINVLIRRMLFQDQGTEGREFRRSAGRCAGRPRQPPRMGVGTRWPASI